MTLTPLPSLSCESFDVKLTDADVAAALVDEGTPFQSISGLTLSF
jgi:hypothetical protein